MNHHRARAEFDEFTVYPDFGEIYRNRINIGLRPKELAVFWLLVSAAGELVSKERIVAEVWNGMSVSDESISRCVSVIKCRLRAVRPGADAAIRTVYGRGYRFAGPVSFTEISLGSPGRLPTTAVRPAAIGEIATRDLLTAEPDTTVLDAARALRAQRRGSIVILNERRPVGIWTDADVLRLDLQNPRVLDLTMAEVMQSSVVTLDQWKPISDAVVLMRTHNIRHLILVDENEHACGVVSQSDVVYNHGVESFMTVKDVRSVADHNPVVVRRDMAVAEATRHMRDNDTGVLIVDLPHKPPFAFAERDAMQALANRQLHSPLAQLDLPPLVSVASETSILVARQLMDIKKVRHLAVVNGGGEFVKILSLSDILADIEHSYLHLIEEILEHNRIAADTDIHTNLLASAVKQTSGMMIITDHHGDIEYVNTAFESISGYSADEVKGRNPRFLSSGLIPKAVFQQMWEAITAGRTWKGELCNRKKSGERYWVLSSVTPIVDDEGHIHHYIAVEEDITDRKEVENRLLEIEQRFYDMVEHSLILIWESDRNGSVVFLNRRWLRFTGRPLSKQLGNGWADQIHPDDLNDYLEAFQHALALRKSFCLDHRLKNAAGTYRWVMNLAMPRYSKTGEFLGLRGACVDITERKIKEMTEHAVP